ncbi:MAG: guanine deaminase [Cryomorphaceae bacterium]|jgi:guanine deaminase
MNQTTAYRGEILHFLDDPTVVGSDNSYEYFADGLLLVENGLVTGLGSYSELASSSGNVELTHYQNGLIVPGFIDTHVHYPQVEIMASHGEQLLEWLANYTFPAEMKFSDPAYASEIANFFLDQLLSNGTTTALVFGTVHPQSVSAFFSAAQTKQLRMICGKVLMDRNAPDGLMDDAQSAYKDSQRLIEQWHGKDRLQYAVTPRFAVTSTDQQLAIAEKLLKEFPGVYLHTHLSENRKEIAWVKKLFPDSKDYLDVYHKHGLTGPRSVFAHGVHLSDDECQCLADTGSSIAFCPSSNLFLGSGLFNLKQAENFAYGVGFGSDIGAGTSLSMLQIMSEAYKTQQLRDDGLSPFKSFYLATLGGARVLDLENTIGNFKMGNEADFVFLDYHSTPLMQLRLSHCHSLHEKLFALSILGDDRTVGATHILGKKVH